jgi:TRAP-type C4-dicarboxylate transport system permease small subunit
MMAPEKNAPEIHKEPTLHHPFHKLIQRVSTALAWVAFAIILLMAMHVASSVLLRWVTGRDIPVTTETATYYYMVALTFLPLAFVEMEQKHLNAEFFYMLFPRWGQKILDVLISLLMLTYIGFLSWRTLLNAIDRTRSEEVISTASGLYLVWPARWIVPISLAVTFLFILSKLLGDLTRPKPLSDGAQDTQARNGLPEAEHVEY